MRFLRLLDRGTPAAWIGAAMALLIAIGTADSQTGPNVTFALFYTLPIALAAWCCGPYVGWAFALVCAVMWIVVDVTKGRFEVALWAYTWNFGSRLALLMAFSVILTALREALHREKELARRDFVTHTFNLRAFHELAQLEILRSRRHQRPLTLVYIDVDHFKAINDRLGHGEGDRFLRNRVSRRARRRQQAPKQADGDCRGELLARHLQPRCADMHSLVGIECGLDQAGRRVDVSGEERHEGRRDLQRQSRRISVIGESAQLENW